MQVKYLDGFQHRWVLTGHMAHGKISNRSTYHLRARRLLSSIFPTLQILEEVPIPLRKSETLFLDFYLPLKKLCVEVHGEQHYKFIPFYHNDILGFLKAQKKYREKIEWCENNNITLVELPYNESTDEWSSRLNT